jgi:hypothetical protein
MNKENKINIQTFKTIFNNFKINNPLHPRSHKVNITLK